MEPLEKPQIPILTQLGVILVVLPYFSRYKGWKWLLKSQCKETSKFWSKNEAKFLQKHKTTIYTDFYSQLDKHGKDVTGVVKSRKFNEESYLRIFFDKVDKYFFFRILGIPIPSEENKDGDYTEGNIRFLEYNKLELKNIESKDLNLCSVFIKNSRHTRLNFLVLKSNRAEIGKLTKSFKVLFPIVHEEIFIDGFELTTEDLFQIVRLAKNVRRLVLTYCGISLSGVKDRGTIRGCKIKYLSVFGTITGMTDRGSLVDFLEMTDLKDSLEKLHISYEPSLDKEVREKLEAIGFVNTKVVADSHIPISKSTVMAPPLDYA